MNARKLETIPISVGTNASQGHTKWLVIYMVHPQSKQAPSFSFLSFFERSFEIINVDVFIWKREYYCMALDDMVDNLFNINI